MVNQSFTQLSGIERQEKLQAALQCMTDNALTDTELTAIRRGSLSAAVRFSNRTLRLCSAMLSKREIRSQQWLITSMERTASTF